MNSIKIKAAFAVFVAGTIALAGPNKDAELFIDLAATTSDIDSNGMGLCVADSSFTAGVVIYGARKLYSYQYYISFDTTRLKFISAAKGNDSCKNFLESKGGSNSFSGNLSRDDKTSILVKGYLTGDDSSQSVNGAGILALITFKKRTGDTTLLSLTKPIIIDFDLNEDTACVTHGAKVFPGTIGVLDSRVYSKGRQAITISNGTVRILMPSGAQGCRAIISDISGREIRRFFYVSDRMVADIKSASQGIYYISIVQGNKTSSYPLLIKR
jgi:hypothetical protein